MLPSYGFTRVKPLLAAVACVAVIVGCEQNYESGLACPTLCPQQADSLRDTTFYAVDFDTSIIGYPTTGTEGELILSNHAALDLRAIVRFDTLQATFKHRLSAVDSELVSISSAVMKILIARGDTVGPPVTFELYDVETDSTQDDTTTAALTPLFVGSRLLGTRTVPADSMKDSVLVPIDSQKLMDKIRTLPFGRLRVGIRITAPSPTSVSIFSSNGGFAPFLFIRPSTDSMIDSITIAPSSKTPADQQIANEVRDFQLVSSAPLLPGADAIRVGGIPGQRAYLRFNIPSKIIDSSSVVRATLILTQKPNTASYLPTDTAGVVPFELGSGSAITDLRRALIFLYVGMDSVGMAPQDSGQRSFEMIEAIRRWRFTTAGRTPRALALRAMLEGTSAWQADFYSHKAALSVRPRLRVTYVPLIKQALP
jgi:hypothetical protein